MSRQTTKVKNTEDYIRLATRDKQQFINKLGRLEDLEEQIGCPLEVFVKLTLGQKIWVEVDGMKCYEGNHYAEIDTSFDVDEDDWGETEFWAWYSSYLGDYTKASDHVILKVKDYKKTWWLKEDKSE